MTIEITTRTIEAPSGMPIFQAYPSAEGSYPTFILLHERYGLNQHTMNLSSMIAERGYAVLAPHLYFRFEDQQGLRDGSVAHRITDTAALVDLDEALSTASELPGADTTRLGMFGACATGRYPIVWGANRHLDVAVVMHGLYRVREWQLNPEQQSEEMPSMVRRLEAAFLGQFGELDRLVSVDDVRFIRNNFEEVNQSYQITLYRDAPHGWMDSTMDDRHRPEIAALSFVELAAFLEDHLRSPRRAPRSEVSWRYCSTKAIDYDYQTP